MRTAKQIAASRANGQKPHGPTTTTTAGKAKSRYNALKHGIHAESQIMFDQTAEDLAELAAELHHQHDPAVSTERFLVDTLIDNEWRLRTVEADLWQTSVNTHLEKHTEIERASSGDAFATSERLQRIVNSCERAYHHAVKTLAVPKWRGPVPPTLQPEENTASSESPGSFCTNLEASATKAPEPPFFPPRTPFSTPNCPPQPQTCKIRKQWTPLFQAIFGQ
jgi:hypothetical protein